jgi:hypothetical protein
MDVVDLDVPRSPSGVVVLAHDNGNVIGRCSLAEILTEAGLAVATFSLLSRAERQQALFTHRAAVSLALLTDRLSAGIDAIREHPETGSLPLGIAGAGIIGAVALHVASLRPFDVDAIVCRRARLDLLNDLQYVRAATLLIASVSSTKLVADNDLAFSRLQCPKRFAVLGGAMTNLEEEEAFRKAAELTRDWFVEHLHAFIAASA